mgnify:CR=1 FL=1|jgi:hypothetical protein
MKQIKWNPDIKTINDSLVKLLPTGGGTDPASLKVQQKEKELTQAMEDMNNQQESQGQDNTPLPSQATKGSDITGLQGNAQQSTPTQPGVIADAPPVLPQLSKTYFKDTFGIRGEKLVELLEKGGEHEIIPSVLALLRAEQRAILKQYEWWDNDDITLRLQDNDYNLLAKYPDRLELPLRQTIVALKKANTDEEVDEIWKTWDMRLNAENRISRRERTILKACNEVLTKNGHMNAQTISSYGVKGTTQEVASLIKAYGYLYDLKVVGKGTKNDDRTLYYGTNKPPLFLKEYDSFIGNLWEVEGRVEMSPTGSPRLFLPFNSKRAEDYTVVLKRELGVEGIMWEGKQFVIEGDQAVIKAANLALPFLNKKKTEAHLILASLEGNENAGRILAFQHADLQHQTTLLKAWNVPIDTLDSWLEDIING